MNKVACNNNDDIYTNYKQNAEAVIFVVDSNDRDRIDDKNGLYSNNEYNMTAPAREELHSMLIDNELSNKPLLILANKQDLPHAMSVDEISDRLGLNIIKDRQWKVQATCATTGEGLYDGLDWLSSALTKRRKK